MRDKLSQITEIVHENLTKAQAKQKMWYNKNVQLREFKAGDLVLVLLPSSSNKLLAQWQGLYSIEKRFGRVTYLVDSCMHDRAGVSC